MFFNPAQAALVVIDIQDKLAPTIHGIDNVVRHAGLLLDCASVLGIPVLITEQYPAGLGPTIPTILEKAPSATRIEKTTFSCCRAHTFIQALDALGRHQIILAGIETHVCVFQTAVDLITRSYRVQVVADAVSSRTESNRSIGIERMRRAGVDVTSFESVIFELLETSNRPEFKQVLKAIKRTEQA